MSNKNRKDHNQPHPPKPPAHVGESAAVQAADRAHEPGLTDVERLNARRPAAPVSAPVAVSDGTKGAVDLYNERMAARGRK